VLDLIQINLQTFRS